MASAECSFGSLLQPERRANVRQNQGGVTQRGQIDEDPAIGEPITHLLCHRQRQAGLTHPTRAGQGDHADPVIPK